jgi:hypothetical protein
VSAPARPDSAVRPEFGPSLPQLLRTRFGVPPIVPTVAVAVLVLGAIVVALALRGHDVRMVHRSPPVFNLRYAKVLHRSPPHPGVLLELEGRRGDLFLQSLTIRPLHLPPYRGAVSGLLPVYAEPHVRAVSRRYDGFVALGEGKARINEAPGYQVGFRARLGRRTIYGREILLVPDEPGAREGVVITLVQTHASGAHSVDDVGAVGALKKPLRSFRFGVETK